MEDKGDEKNADRTAQRSEQAAKTHDRSTFSASARCRLIGRRVCDARAALSPEASIRTGEQLYHFPPLPVKRPQVAEEGEERAPRSGLMEGRWRWASCPGSEPSTCLRHMEARDYRGRAG